MADGKSLLVKSWLAKANNDLHAARTLSGSPDRLLDVAVYHCQQAAEKAIKGYFVLRDARFTKTHDIGDLVSMARAIDSGFDQWQDAADLLTPYATSYRYPGESVEPTAEEYQRAFSAAQGIFDFILSLMPRESQPSE
ncbi:MAG: HEPN domain-containing protein [Candidatus Edwardsbacteria bacterium]|nr:HEPN domain-containing protein [Candidatus Edwardsbacteria bacterium]